MTDSLIALPLLGFLAPLALTPVRLASRRRTAQALDEAYRERHIH